MAKQRWSNGEKGEDSVAEAIIGRAMAHYADLMALGTHGRIGLAR